MPAASPTLTRAPFRRYASYVERIRGLMTAPLSAANWQAQTDAALDGEASAQLRALTGKATRRKFGAFFTGSTLSQRLLARSRVNEGLAYDPTCGMGDLLVAAARRLPLGRTLIETLDQWGGRLAGTDLHDEFITGTKTRLVLLARRRHGIEEATPVLNLDDLFPNVRVADGLAVNQEFSAAKRLLMNPPFGQMRATSDCDWADGKVSRAAEFVIHALENVQEGTELLAILPDVLRSGSFSTRWRDRVSQLAEVHCVRACGLFDESADVDVFLLHLVRRRKAEAKSLKKWPQRRRSQAARLADYFEVSVGRVVPHRDPETGPLYPYIHPRGVPAWETMRYIPEHRRHSAHPFRAPFVVIRRTSRPEHPHRATGSIIGGNGLIAVENHLIVCTPKDGTLRSCRRLLQELQKKRVNHALNQRIRCRHLTVGAVGDIPFTPASSIPKRREISQPVASI